MNTATPIEGEVLDSMPAAPAPQPTALVTAGSPYLSMAQRAMELDKVEQLGQLMVLHREWDAEQQRKAFVSAMAAFKAEPIDIRKTKGVGYSTKDGDFVGYKHATLADVVDGVVAAMGKHGMSHRWDVKQENGQIIVTCLVAHRDGHTESVAMQGAPDDSGKKNKIQQVASTVAYLQRYTLMAATGVAAKDMDDDARVAGAPSVECINEAQEKILEDLISAYVANKEKFMDWVRGATKDVEVKVVADIQAQHFELVHAQLGRIRAQKEPASV
jgi:hypothetical protein